MKKENFAPITQEPIFKHVMSDEKNCLGLLNISLEDLDLQSAEIVPGRFGADNTDHNWNQLNILAKDRLGEVYNIKLNMFNNKRRYKRYVEGMSPTTWKPVRSVQVKKTYVICFCTFDPFDENKAVYDINIRRQNDDHEMENYVHLKIFNAAAV